MMMEPGTAMVVASVASTSRATISVTMVPQIFQGNLDAAESPSRDIRNPLVKGKVSMGILMLLESIEPLCILCHWGDLQSESEVSIPPGSRDQPDQSSGSDDLTIEQADNMLAGPKASP